MKESFVDLEKLRLDILEEKIESCISHFDLYKNAQWNSLKLEKPLLEALLKLVKESKGDNL